RQRSRDASAKVVPVSKVRVETAKPLLPSSFLQKCRQCLRSRPTPESKPIAYNMRKYAQKLGELVVAPQRGYATARRSPSDCTCFRSRAGVSRQKRASGSIG